jgi:hypothetical protein
MVPAIILFAATYVLMLTLRPSILRPSDCWWDCS